MAKQTDKVAAVVETMKTNGISQLPVTDDSGWIKGIISETIILKALFLGEVNKQSGIESLTNASIEFVSPFDPVEKLTKLVTAGKTPLVVDPAKHDELLAIITKIDLISYLGS